MYWGSAAIMPPHTNKGNNDMFNNDLLLDCSDLDQYDAKGYEAGHVSLPPYLDELSLSERIDLHIRTLATRGKFYN
jgi:hypothetical protein